MMRARLGDAAWNDFVSHANMHYKDTYVRAFDADVLRCVGTIDRQAVPAHLRPSFLGRDFR